MERYTIVPGEAHSGMPEMENSVGTEISTCLIIPKPHSIHIGVIMPIVAAMMVRGRNILICAIPDKNTMSMVNHAVI